MVTLPPPLADPPAVLPLLALGDEIGGSGKLIISSNLLFDCYVNPLVQLSDLSTRISRRKIFEDC